MTICTIGYEGATVPELVAALQDAGVELLIDVRAVTSSRRPGFSKNALAAELAAAGIEYRHLKALGTPKAGRDAARKGDKTTLESIYAGQLALPEAQAEAAVMTGLAAVRRAALLCYERDPGMCHRSILIRAVMPHAEVEDLFA
ncbi:MAG: DUF488 domain-containing protein [Sphingomonas sanxanigenens]|uniref:DUF488 domain-containing protein n=1 Tax=Sphingomonas sanxanigenens TaxID=397260 RepID=A0A2W5A2W2_9SPHN|nr:MAG: DUF488 domain-containing protein [Sphingomonas sanxanigenens]